MCESEDINDTFSAAANFIQSNHDKFVKNDLLKFYGYYKQSTVGKCNIAKPGMFSFQEKAKYEAWNSLGNLNSNEAKISYIEHLSKLIPNWQDKKCDNSFGAFVSRPRDDDEIIKESDKCIIDFIKEGNVDKLKNDLQVHQQDLNILDDNGLGLIHWAADRGNAEILQVLLDENQIDINLKDAEGQT